MSTHSKYININAVLNDAEGSLGEIERQYQEALRVQQLPEVLLVKIKDYLGNLRSALDYLNCKIKNSDIYFPICDSVSDFNARYNKITPQLKTILIKWQPYNGHSWLKWLNVLNNKNKHVTLNPQKRNESIETRVTTPSGSGISWTSGVTFGEGVSVMGVPINPTTQLPVPNKSVKTERITWVDFKFDNSGVFSSLPSELSALPFLKKCFDNVSAIVKEVEVELR